MSVAEQHKLTAAAYLSVERKAETRSEFLDGEVFSMAGGSHRHSLIATNLAGELRAGLKAGSCQVLNSDMRVLVRPTGLYAYPDVSVACGQLEFEDEVEDTLLNPKVIAEVLSESTAAWDRGKKFWHYRHLDSLTDYLLVSQDAWLVEHYARQTDSIGCRVELSELFARVQFET
jgi:Uma2 family endonuclease